MNIFLLTYPRNSYLYAHFAVVGTWKEGRYCETCTYPHSRIVSPLQVEWEPGSTIVGDFTWDLCYTYAVTKDARRKLEESSLEFRFGSVEHKPNSERIGKRQKLIRMPYKGPPIYWAYPRFKLSLNEKLSRVRVEESCPACGRIAKTFKRSGIVIDKSSWRGEKVFSIMQNAPSNATFVTDEGRRLLEEFEFTNIGFAKAGRIGG